MNRRGFIASIAALVVAPFVPTPAETGLSTFNVATKQWRPAAVDGETGIAIRFIRSWDDVAKWESIEPMRYDVMYGLPFEYNGVVTAE